MNGGGSAGGATIAELQEIWLRLDGRLRRFLTARMRPAETVEDTLQEIYLKIHTKIGSLRDPERIESWIFRIARNAVIDYYRSRRPVTVLTEEVPVHDEQWEDRQLESELRGMVRSMVATMPEIYRQALEAADFGGLRQAGVAARLGISPSTFKARVQRGRKLLKRMLLDCCHFQFDRVGRIIDNYPRCERCCEGACAR